MKAVMEGAVFASHSLAHVNRELALALDKLGVEVSFVPFGIQDHHPGVYGRKLREMAKRHPENPDFWIRHRWPPEFNEPPGGKLIVIQPWEFGCIPRSWVKPVNRWTDQIWVPSRFVRDAFVVSGVGSDVVRVVPNGVRTDIFSPEGESLRPAPEGSFVFLFVGGVLQRKGVDLLLKAYEEEFHGVRDVCLLIKSASCYETPLGRRVKQLAENGHFPRVVVVEEDLAPKKMAALYRGADCYVQPFRSEGFCLPVFEALSSGLTVITTDSVPVTEFVSEREVFLIPSRTERFASNVLEGWKLTDRPFWNEPDLEALKDLMRRAYEGRLEREASLQETRERLSRELSWEKAASVALEGLEGRMSPGKARRRRRKQKLLSVCMIAKNEEEALPRSLASISEVADEVIVVDTGSTDKTIEVARSFGAKVAEREWKEDFAAARNESLEQASGKWILVLDADEQLDYYNAFRLRRLIEDARPDHLVFSLLILSDADSSATGIETAHFYPRLFRNLPGIHFKGKLHEQLSYPGDDVNSFTTNVDITIRHSGYAKGSVAKCKARRNLQVIRREVAESGYSGKAYLNLAHSLIINGEYEEALEAYAGIARKDPDFVKGPLDFANVAYCLWRLGKGSEARRELRKARKKYPEAMAPRMVAIDIDLEQGRFERAAKSIDKMLHRTSLWGDLSADIHPSRWLFMTLQARCLLAMGYPSKAAGILQTVLEKEPNLAVAHIELGCVYLNLGVREKAKAEFDKAYELDPDLPTVTLPVQTPTAGDPFAVIGPGLEAPQFKMPAMSSGGPTLSLCMIVRDEEQRLARCLESVAGIADEIVVVDTGSTDRTVEVAKRFGAKVEHYAWDGDFSKARNKSLELATGDWILFLDADEELDPESVPELRRLVRDEKTAGINVQIKNYLPAGGLVTVFKGNYCRLFRNLPEIRFEGAVHEQILPSIQRARGRVVSSSITIEHHGYSFDRDALNNKRMRDLEILKKEVAEHPEDAFNYLNLGLTYMALGNVEEAVKVLPLSLRQGKRSLPYALLAVAHTKLAQAYWSFGEKEKALTHLDEALFLVPGNALALYVRAAIHFEDREFEKSLSCLERIVTRESQPSTYEDHIDRTQLFLDMGNCHYSLANFVQARGCYERACELDSRNPKIWYNLGNCFVQLEELEQALHAFGRAVELDPGFAQAEENRRIVRKYMERIPSVNRT